MKELSGIAFEPPSFGERLLLFQSMRQALHYAAVMLPALVLFWLLGWALGMEDPKWPLIGAAIGSLVHLAVMLPARISCNTALAAKTEPEVRAWLEKEGYQEARPGRYVYPSKFLAYRENCFQLYRKNSVLIIEGPEYQIRRLIKYLIHTNDN